jgi:uncharacterized protein YjbI with pentapeptide repeats
MKKIKKPIHRLPLETYKESKIDPLDNDTIDYTLFMGNEMTHREDYRIVFDVCKFEKSNITNNTFRRSEFIDCIFINSDLSNNTFTNCTFIRCEFINCKMIGSHFIDSYIENTLIKSSIADLLDIANSKIKILAVKETSMKDSSWFENKVDGMLFSKNDFTKATFFETPLKDVNIGTCEIDKLRIDHNSVKELQIASHQAEAFCDLLGIRVTQ